jgi:hypothetical protein
MSAPIGSAAPQRAGPYRARALVLAAALLVLGTACSKASATTSPGSYRVFAQQFRFHGLPAHVQANSPFDIVFTNREGFPFRHEMVLVGIDSGQGADDIVNAAKKTGQDSEDQWLHFGEIGEVNTGSTKVGVFSLPPGTYALVCWEDEKPGGGTGPVHAARGMVFEFAVP